MDPPKDRCPNLTNWTSELNSDSFLDPIMKWYKWSKFRFPFFISLVLQVPYAGTDRSCLFTLDLSYDGDLHPDSFVRSLSCFTIFDFVIIILSISLNTVYYYQILVIRVMNPVDDNECL